MAGAGGINSVEREMGDFAPLAITWPLLLMDPNNDVFVNHFAPRPGMDTESAEARAQIARRRLGRLFLFPPVARMLSLMKLCHWHPVLLCFTVNVPLLHNRLWGCK